MFVDALNVRGEIQTVPEHYLTDFPDQFKPLTEPTKPTPPAKAATSKES